MTCANFAVVIEKAKRLVEPKKDVVILLDSITRLARARLWAENGTDRFATCRQRTGRQWNSCSPLALSAKDS